MKKSPQIEELIPHESMWKATEGGFKRFSNIHKVTTGTFDFIPEEKLEAIQPGLANAVRIMDKAAESLFGVYLHRALTIWHNEQTVMATDGRLVALTTIKSVDMTQKFVRFKGSSWVYKEAIEPTVGLTYKIPTDGATKITTVSREWMNAHYPGWDKRYQIMETLGVDDAALIASIFSKQDVSEELALPADMSL